MTQTAAAPSYAEMTKSQLIGIIETQKARLREIEETHKREMRELQWHDEIMGNTDLPISARYAARAVRKFAQTRQPLDDGYYKAYLPAMAELSGVSASTISRGLETLSSSTAVLDKLTDEVRDERGHVEKSLLYFRVHDGFDSAQDIVPTKDVPKHGGNRRLPCPECGCVHRRVKRVEECAACAHKFFEQERIIRGDEPLQDEMDREIVLTQHNLDKANENEPLQDEMVEASNESEEPLQVATLTIDTLAIHSITSCNDVPVGRDAVPVASCNDVPAKPITPFIDNPLALAELKDRRIWLCWRWEWKDGKWTKRPYIADLVGTHGASINNLAHGRLYAWALACYTQSQSWNTDDKKPFDGIGFLCDGSFTFVDWDHCRDPQTGEVQQEAVERARAIDSYTELSVSGHGIHTYAWGNIPESRRDSARGVEMYDNNRFCVFTGMPLPDFPQTLQARGDELKVLHSQLFLPKPKCDDLAGPLWDSGDEPGSDEEIDAILSKAMHARNGAKFRLLYEGQWQQVLDEDGKQYYPSHSEAVLALCRMLAYWTARRVSTLDSLFRRSGLMSEKWLREDYRTETIQKALC